MGTQRTSNSTCATCRVFSGRYFMCAPFSRSTLRPTGGSVQLLPGTFGATTASAMGGSLTALSNSRIVFARFSISRARTRSSSALRRPPGSSCASCLSLKMPASICESFAASLARSSAERSWASKCSRIQSTKSVKVITPSRVASAKRNASCASFCKSMGSQSTTLAPSAPSSIGCNLREFCRMQWHSSNSWNLMVPVQSRS
mmetsp:Transcript_90636/g.293404  ORF Transcript_90636/g.293404 Transcript_90636/m.293404 type:complete len:202 (+) Transcript_90636:708-1313(+)